MTVEERPKDAADAPLECRVVDGRLVLSVGVNTLAFAWDHRSEVECANEEGEPPENAPQGWPFKVVDATAFAREVARAILDEAEDGSTPADIFLDQACEAAADDGAEGLDYGYAD